MRSTTDGRASAKIADLQVLRGIAISLVVVQHSNLTVAFLDSVWHAAALPFWLGVDSFFVVGGYVIAASLMRDRFEPLGFFVKRVFRLTPPSPCWFWFPRR